MPGPEGANPRDQVEDAGLRYQAGGPGPRDPVEDGGPRPRWERASLRDQVVDVLERSYGPTFLGLAFAWLFATSDPAQEVILGFVQEFGPPQGPLWLALFPSTGGLFSEVFWRSTSSILLLGSVPVAIWSAAWLAVRQSGTVNRPLARRITAGTGVIVALILIWGFRRSAMSPEAHVIAAWRYWFAALCSLLGVGTGFLLHWSLLKVASFTFYSQRRPNRTEVLGALIALLMLVAPVVWIGFFAPERAHLFGPIGVACGFVIAAAYLLAALTMLSRHAPGNLPLILVLVAMVLATGSRTIAILLTAAAVLALVPRLVAWVSRKPPEDGPLSGLPWLYPWMRAGWGTILATLLVAAFGTTAALLLRHPPPCGSLAGCNLLSGVVPQTPAQKRLPETFADWSGRNAPVVRIVAAQGGGLYAAYHTAYYLSARADTDPEFARSLFLISGVSGGSVGAGVFWAIRRSGLCDDAPTPGTCHRDAVKRILQYDFLSPTLAAFLFRDALDTVVPYSYLSETPTDRARVLERMFAARIRLWAGEAAAAQGKPVPPDDGWLDTALADSWAPEAGLPLLMLNATEVGSGARQILSPLPHLAPEGSPEVPGRVLLEGGRDLTVGNAMTISARFPVVTPPARIRRPDESGRIVVRQLVDGGYFDNSGIETLMETITAIRLARGAAPVEVLVFTVEEKPTEIGIKGTIAAPLDAFTSAWRARRDLTARRLREAVLPPTGPSTLRVCDVRLYQQTANFTVSWFLTAETFLDIQIQIDAEVAPSTFRYQKAAPSPRDLCHSG